MNGTLFHTCLQKYGHQMAQCTHTHTHSSQSHRENILYGYFRLYVCMLLQLVKTREMDSKKSNYTVIPTCLVIKNHQVVAKSNTCLYLEAENIFYLTFCFWFFE